MRPEDVDEMYREAVHNDEFCSGGEFTRSVAEEPDDEDEVMDFAAIADKTGSGSAAFDFLEQVRLDGKALDPQQQGDDMPAAEPSEADIDLKGVFQADVLSSLLEAPQPGEPFRSEQGSPPPKKTSDPDKLPNTLSEALGLGGNFMNRLLRLAIRLRSVRGGIDTSFVPNPRNTRIASGKLNWHQPLGSFFILFIFYHWMYLGVLMVLAHYHFVEPHARWNERQIHLCNLERKDGDFRSRTSRMEKWKEQVRLVHRELKIAEAPPERLVLLGPDYIPTVSHCIHLYPTVYHCIPLRCMIKYGFPCVTNGNLVCRCFYCKYFEMVLVF